MMTGLRSCDWNQNQNLGWQPPSGKSHPLLAVKKNWSRKLRQTNIQGSPSTPARASFGLTVNLGQPPRSRSESDPHTCLGSNPAKATGEGEPQRPPHPPPTFPKYMQTLCPSTQAGPGSGELGGHTFWTALTPQHQKPKQYPKRSPAQA